MKDEKMNINNKANLENSISKDKNYLINLSNANKNPKELEYLLNNFCGTVVKSQLEIPSIQKLIRVYAIGNMEELNSEENMVLIIKELSSNYENIKNKNVQIVGLGEVPINIHNVGVFYRKYFDGSDYFSKIESEHTFQYLSESNKDSTAFRKGIYLTKVSKELKANKSEILNFRLLRCSTNLTGATDNFRKTDNEIIDALNETVKYDFEKEVELNHVLAQIYENKKRTDGRQVKAKIKAHSDKTKDMSAEAVMAFCTFYDDANFERLKPSKSTRFDWCYKNTSGLTRLLFKLKKNITDDSLVKEFSLTLYPNSVFLIPLITNRLYTHEIRPSVLDIDMIPIRMGYVIRCSNLEASYIDDQTYIKENENLVKLEKMTDEMLKDLRDSYYKENKTEEFVDYGKVHFSMNMGDYEKPIY